MIVAERDEVSLDVNSFTEPLLCWLLYSLLRPIEGDVTVGDRFSAVTSAMARRMDSMTHRSRFSEEELSFNPYDIDSSDESDDGIHPTVSSYPQSRQRPLIDYVKNEWQTNPKYRDISNSPSPDRLPEGLLILVSIVTAPKFRRYIIVYFVLLLSCWMTWKGILGPQIAEHTALLRSLDTETMKRVGGWYGTNVMPKFSDIIHMKTLDPSLLPGDEPLEPGDKNRRRLIIVGDVHGCKDERMF